MDNKRMHELLQKIEVHKSCLNASYEANDIEAQYLLPSVFMPDILEMLQHLWEVDIERMKKYKNLEKEVRDFKKNMKKYQEDKDPNAT